VFHHSLARRCQPNASIRSRQVEQLNSAVYTVASPSVTPCHGCDESCERALRRRGLLRAYGANGFTSQEFRKLVKQPTMMRKGLSPPCPRPRDAWLRTQCPRRVQDVVKRWRIGPVGP
jgi:hypothetical protein